ncbi:MAG: ACP S-malonyltransferase [Dehalococcoidia bacterium]
MPERGDRVAWVFPGQGSQEVGMGRDLAEASPAARRVLETADAVLDYPLSHLCFEGPEDTLRQTAYAQPAIFTVSLACLEAARELGGLSEEHPAFVAGHSLGEYTALVAAGALDLEEGLRLVQERGRLMQEAAEANPGTMAALIGLDDADVAELCTATGAELCNLNSPGQVVIGGPVEVVEAAVAAARERGAQRAVRLNVSGAFHTSLTAPAAQGMARAAAEAPLRDTAIPVVVNGTGLPAHSASDIREELVYQLTHPVRWRESVEFMAGAGVSGFVEIGPGRVLSGLIRRTVPGASVRTIGDAASARAQQS